MGTSTRTARCGQRSRGLRSCSHPPSWDWTLPGKAAARNADQRSARLDPLYRARRRGSGARDSCPATRCHRRRREGSCLRSGTAAGLPSSAATTRSDHRASGTRAGASSKHKRSASHPELWREQCKAGTNTSQSWECYRRFGEACVAAPQPALVQGRRVFPHRSLRKQFFHMAAHP